MHKIAFPRCGVRSVKYRTRQKQLLHTRCTRGYRTGFQLLNTNEGQKSELTNFASSLKQAMAGKPTTPLHWENYLQNLSDRRLTAQVLSEKKIMEQAGIVPTSKILSICLHAFNAETTKKVERERTPDTLWTHHIRRDIVGLQIFELFDEHRKYRLIPLNTSVTAVVEDCILRRSMDGVWKIFTKNWYKLEAREYNHHLIEMFEKFLELSKICRQPSIARYIYSKVNLANFPQKFRLLLIEALCSLPNKENMDKALGILRSSKTWDESFFDALQAAIDSCLYSGNMDVLFYICDKLHQQGHLYRIDSGTALRIVESFVRLGTIPPTMINVVKSLCQLLRSDDRDNFAHIQVQAMVYLQLLSVKDALMFLSENLPEITPGTIHLFATLLPRLHNDAEARSTQWVSEDFARVKTLYKEICNERRIKSGDLFRDKIAYYQEELNAREKGIEFTTPPPTEFPSISLPVLNIILTSYAYNASVKETLQVFSDIEKLFGHTYNLDSYNAILACFSRFGEAQKAYDTVNEILRKKVEGDTATLDYLFRSFCSDEVPSKKLLDVIFIYSQKIKHKQDIRTYFYLLDYFLSKNDVVTAMNVAEFGITLVPCTMEDFTPVLNKHAEILSNFQGEIPSVMHYYHVYSEAHNKTLIKEAVDLVKKYLGEQSTELLTSKRKAEFIQKQSAMVEILRPRFDRRLDSSYGPEELQRDMWETPESMKQTITQINMKFLPPVLTGEDDWSTEEGLYRLKTAIWHKMKTTPRPWATDILPRVPTPGKINRVENRYVPETNSFVTRFTDEPVTDFTTNNPDFFFDTGLEYLDERNALDKKAQSDAAEMIKKIREKFEENPVFQNFSDNRKEEIVMAAFQQYLDQYFREAQEITSKFPGTRLPNPGSPF